MNLLSLTNPWHNILTRLLKISRPSFPTGEAAFFIMTDIVILHKKSFFPCLKYAIRAVRRYVDFRKLWVVGHKPDYYEGNHIPDNNEYYIPQVNTTNKILKAASHSEVAEQFILLHDDMFLNAPYEPKLYYHGTLREKMNRIPGRRKQCLQNVLKITGEGAKNYELHYPMPFCKDEIRDILEGCDWKRGICYYSLYGNLTESFPKEHKPDCKWRPRHDIKAIKRGVGGMDCWSTHEVHETEKLIPLLEKLYPKPKQVQL